MDDASVDGENLIRGPSGPPCSLLGSISRRMLGGQLRNVQRGAAPAPSAGHEAVTAGSVAASEYFPRRN